MRRVTQAGARLRARLKELDHSMGLSAVGHLIEELQHKCRDKTPRLWPYLETYKNDVLQHLDEFKDKDGEEQLPLLTMRRQDVRSTRSTSWWTTAKPTALGGGRAQPHLGSICWAGWSTRMRWAASPLTLPKLRLQAPFTGQRRLPHSQCQ